MRTKDKAALAIMEKVDPDFIDLVSDEWERYERGRIHDTLLIQGLIRNMSINDFMRMTKFKGKAYRHLAPLGERAVELEGQTLLNLIKAILTNNFIKLTTHAGILLILELQSELDTQTNPAARRLLERSIKDAEDAQQRFLRHQLSDMSRDYGDND